MKSIEQEIITILAKIKEKNTQKQFFYQYDEINEYIALQTLFNTLKAHPSAESEEFLDHPLLVEYLSNKDREMWQIYSDGGVDLSPADYLIFWRLIRTYLAELAAQDPHAQESFIAIEKELQKEAIAYKKGLENGTAIHNTSMFYPPLIRELYLAGDAQLIGLFEKYLHIYPKEELFDEHAIPLAVQARSRETTQALHSLFAKKDYDIQSVEKQIIQIQRAFRNNKKMTEHQLRIKEHDSPDTPYRPHCDSALADRLIESASRVELFPTLRHLTNQAALTAIFDNGLAGRKTLIEQSQKFTPAALRNFDITMGDANKICLGPQGIDPTLINEKTVEIIFSGDLRHQEQLPASCKQQDLGFVTNREQYPPVPLFLEDNPRGSLSFIHTEYLSNGKVVFSVLDTHGHQVACAKLSPCDLMTTNLADVSQIFVLNFFKFIDKLEAVRRDRYEAPCRQCEQASSSTLIESIYATIAAFSPTELDRFLQRIGAACTRTAEFNIYGVHNIDFSTIESITARYFFQHDQERALEAGLSDSYVLNMKDFILALSDGNSQKLEEAQQNIPELFKSYRFLEFLHANIQDQTIRAQLKTLHENCQIPRWRKEIAAQQSFSFFGSKTMVSSNSKETSLEAPCAFR